MNRYILAGLVADLRAGKQIALVAGTRIQSRYAFHALTEEVQDESEKVYRANGAESLTHKSGGHLKVYALNSGSLRGVTADVVVVLDSVTLPVKTLEDLHVNIQAMKATRPLELVY